MIRLTELVRHCGAALRRWLIGIAVCAVIAGCYLLGSFDFIEHQLSRARFHLLRADPSGEVVVVAIDASSLQQLPVWPWPRHWHASVIDRLMSAGAKQVAVDIDFSAISGKADDEALAAALARAGKRVILPVFQQVDGAGKVAVASAPLPEFAQHVRIASANVRPDGDGILRRTASLELWSDSVVPTLAGAATMLPGAERALSTRATGGRFYIDFGIRTERIPIVSYADVLNGKADPTRFAGKTVFIGSTALELGDIITTPMGETLPGVLVQALATESLLQGRDLRKIAPWVTLGFGALLFASVTAICQRRSWKRGLAVSIGALLFIIGLPIAVQAQLPLTLDTAPWLVSVGAAFLLTLLRRLRDLDLRVLSQAILLRRTDSLMRRMAQSTNDGILVLDQHGMVQTANPAIERMLGRPASEMVGQHFFDLISSAHSEPIHGLARMAEDERPCQIELTKADRSALIADVSLTRIPDEPSATYVAVLHDVTEMKQREIELRCARDQAQAANNSKTQFLANMSHELRTPLNAMIGFSEIMKGELLGPIGTERYRGYSHSIHDSAKHLLAIINDILDISSIESGSPRLFEDLLEPEKICQSVFGLVSGRAEGAGIELQVVIEPNSDLLFADGRMLKQMLLNLLGNSIKFSPAGSTVTLEVSRNTERSIVFAVIDQGIGIEARDIPRILKPFEQIENVFSRSHDGVGLGLALVKSMVELHGATLAIESEVGKGTRAAIIFPPHRSRPHAAAVPGQGQPHLRAAS